MNQPKISAIVAISKNRVIGKDNDLIFRIPEDQKRFRELTSGHVVVMGRKTFESIGRLLANRTNIIITRDKNYKVEGAVVCHSLDDALNKAKTLSLNPSPLDSSSFLSPGPDGTVGAGEERVSARGGRERSKRFPLIRPSGTFSPPGEGNNVKSLGRGQGEGEIFIIGGGQIYEESMGKIDKLYLTIIDKIVEGGVFFPNYDQFKKVVFEEEKEFEGLKYKFLDLEK